jgi:predicted ester cyclase
MVIDFTVFCPAGVLRSFKIVKRSQSDDARSARSGCARSEDVDMAQGNKEIVRRFFEEFMSEQRLDRVDDFVTADWLYHDPSLPDLHGRDGAQQLVRTVAAGGFRDMRFKIEDSLAESDRVGVRYAFTGTHQATGKKITASGCGIFRIQDGRVAEVWAIFDVMSVQRQLGTIPEAERAGRR